MFEISDEHCIYHCGGSKLTIAQAKEMFLKSLSDGIDQEISKMLISLNKVKDAVKL